MSFELPKDLPTEISTVLSSEAGQAVLNQIIEQAKTPLVQKRDELLSQIANYKSTLSKVDELGGIETLTQAQQARLEAERARQAALAASGDVEAIKKQYSDQLSNKDQELTALRQSILDEKVTSKLSSAIREAKGVPELLEPHLKSRIRSELVDGKVQITVLTSAGTPMINSDGKDATVADLLNEFRSSPIFQRAFEAPIASGTGARASSGAPTSNNPWNPASKNITQQMQMYRQDPATAKRLAAEHGVTLP
jgi:hypothetical protein